MLILHSAAQRLLTGPDGSPARWIQRVRQQPCRLLFLDEIEKAAPEVFDLLANRQLAVWIERLPAALEKSLALRASAIQALASMRKRGSLPALDAPG